MEGKWIEVFRSGSHTDRNGKTGTWTDADLEEMAEKYNSQKEHYAPVVIGHPAENAPAWGWVDGLKAEGGKLYAKCRQVIPEFAEMVRTGMFKKRSISLYPDRLLRHVGFLGAVPPAVKGLADISFAGAGADECTDYDFTEETETMTPTPDIEKLKAELEAEKSARLAAEANAESAKSELEKTAQEFSEARKQARKNEIEAFVDGGIKDGRILPGWKAAGLVEFMCGLDEQAGDFEFSEGEGGRKPASQWFREFLEGFSAHPLFREMVKPEKTDAADHEFAEEMKLADEIAAIAKGGR